MMTFGALVRVAHNPRVPMYVSLLTNVLNALLSSILIFVFWAGHRWGCLRNGSLSPIRGLTCSGVRFNFPSLPFRWGLDRDLLSLALPAAGERLMMRAGDIVIIAMVAVFWYKSSSWECHWGSLDPVQLYAGFLGLRQRQSCWSPKVWDRMIGKGSSKSPVGVSGSPFSSCSPRPYYFLIWKSFNSLLHQGFRSSCRFLIRHFVFLCLEHL